MSATFSAPVAAPVAAPASAHAIPSAPAGTSDNMRACLNAVSHASKGIGQAVADMLALGAAEYLTFDSFRETVKAGLSVAAWSTCTNYMGPMRRAWENGKVSDYCETCRVSGVMAANKLFPAGTGKKGHTEAAPVEPVAAVIIDATSDAIQTATAKADAAIQAAAAEFELDALRAENAALMAENAALRAELSSLKATQTTKGKKAAQTV